MTVASFRVPSAFLRSTLEFGNRGLRRKEAETAARRRLEERARDAARGEVLSRFRATRPAQWPCLECGAAFALYGERHSHQKRSLCCNRARARVPFG